MGSQVTVAGGEQVAQYETALPLKFGAKFDAVAIGSGTLQT
jgi:hypothetical protein